MELLTIPLLRRAAQAQPAAARVHAQVQSVAEKATRDGKPFWELVMGDSEGKMTLRAWSDSPNFALCADLAQGEFLEIEGEFATHPAFGLEARQWTCRSLEEDEVEALLGGSPHLKEKQARDFEAITDLVASIGDPRLRGVCELFLSELGERFRRAAAARSYHHARRGGLVEHVAQMMRTADHLTQVYTSLNRDLLLAGTLFHDVGKLWESCPEARGFGIPYDEKGELIGHITIGVEILNTFWRKLLATEDAAAWRELRPANDEVRTHLIHLITSHHGEIAFGSPVVPKTPEAYALHWVDNLDAKLEMVFAGYQTGQPLTAQITERVRPLQGNLVRPLARFEPPDATPGA